jgi:general secretion pathway protein B
MSFILDALKKAEAERQRQTGPTLLEVRVTQPRRRFPLWIVIIGILLGINILLLAVFVLRRPAVAANPPAAVVAPAAMSTAPVAAAAPATAPPTTAAPATTPPTAAAAAPAIVAPVPFMPTSPAGNIAADADSDGADLAAQNPADFQPAVPANGTGANTRRSGETSHREPPSLSDVDSDLPDLRLDLHVYAAHPADRYALINMHRVREGDVLPDGPRVIAIDRDGVELSYRGMDFMLHPQ